MPGYISFLLNNPRDKSNKGIIPQVNFSGGVSERLQPINAVCIIENELLILARVKCNMTNWVRISDMNFFIMGFDRMDKQLGTLLCIHGTFPALA